MTRTSTFALTINGQSSGQLRADAAGELAAVLARMDGVRLYACTVWQIPDGQAFDDVDIDTASQEFIQCAGSSDRLTIEVRRLDAEGYRQYTAGRAAGPSDLVEKVTYSGGEHGVLAAARELFAAAEASEVFAHYLRTQTIPSTYVLRPLAT